MVIRQLAAVLLLLLLSLCPRAFADSITQEINRVAQDVAALGLGFDGYIVGEVLTSEQKSAPKSEQITKTLKGTYKFRDKDVYVIASKDNDRVLGVYKQYPEAPEKTIKEIIGGLMFEHGEPTAMAHNKLVYWTYDKNGKIAQDTFESARQSGGIQSLVTVKFSSTEPIAFEKSENDSTEPEEKKISVYVMITSDPLSKLFLAYSNDLKISSN